MNSTNICFIGGGNMARSIIGGLVSKGIPAKNIIVSDPFQASLDECSKLGVATSSDNQSAIIDSDVIVLAVKPQIMHEVCLSIQKTLGKNPAVIISIAAGITSDSLSDWLGEKAAIVRCMPNTPALVQLGATALYKNTCVSDTQAKLAESILSAVGIALWVEKENELDAVTALSGSGPAYYFLMMEAMIKAGEELGLSPELAQALTLQTALGAATMAKNSDVDPQELRRRVTSPNGTTQAAINNFEESNFASIVKKAMLQANNRSIELAEEMANN